MAEKCIGCGWCFENCPKHCHTMEDGRHVFLRKNCVRCGRCAEKCYAQALEIIGREMSVSEVVEEVLKDKVFYDNSGGGMTVSGGEPLFQPEFTASLLAEAKKHSLHTCVETCGFALWKNIEPILEDVDIFLYDLKETNSVKHKEFTGVPLEPILENLNKLDDSGVPIILRCPIIPGLNANKKHAGKIAKIAGGLKNIIEINLMPYHPLGTSKLERLGKTAVWKKSEIADPDEIRDLCAFLTSLCSIPVRVP